MTDEQAQVLRVVKDELREVREDLGFKQLVGQMAFIVSADDKSSRKHTPKELFDPANQFFRRVLTDSQFPHAPYNERSWICFLGSAFGLVTRINLSSLLRCARVVEENKDEESATHLKNRRPI